MLSDRLSIERTLLADWAWFLAVCESFSEDVIHREVTQDQHDPDVWWTVKDHVVHCFGTRDEATMYAEFIAGTDPNASLVLNSGKRMDFSQPIDEVMRLAEEGNYVGWERHRDKSWSEVLAMGQRSRGERLLLLASLTDEQLAQPIPPEPYGNMFGTLGGFLTFDGFHLRMHLGWVLDGLAQGRQSAPVHSHTH